MRSPSAAGAVRTPAPDQSAPWPGLRGIGAVLLVGAGAAVAQAFGRFTFGAILPAVRDDLGLSNSAAGSLATINVLAYLIGTLVVATASARFRLLGVMRCGFAVSLGGLGLTSIAPGFAVLAVAMFCSGLGGALIWIPSPVVAAGALAPERRSLAVALLGSGIGLGVVFSGQLTGWVRSTMGDASWRTVYQIETAIGFVVVLAVLALIRHRQAPPSGRAGVGGFGALRRMRGWLPLTAAYTAFGFMYLLVIAFLSTRLEDDSGWSEGQASLAFTFVGLAMVGGGPVFIALANRIGPRLSLSVAFALWGSLSALILGGWLLPTLAASAVMGLIFGGIPGTITLYVVDNTSADDYGPAFSAATLSFGVAQMASPQVGGWLADLTGSFTWVFLLSTALAALGLLASLGLPGRSPVVRPAGSGTVPLWVATTMTFIVQPTDESADRPRGVPPAQTGP